MGHVCIIPDTKDFFIAYGDHPEWGTAHTVRRWVEQGRCLVLAVPLLQIEAATLCGVRCTLLAAVPLYACAAVSSLIGRAKPLRVSSVST